MRKVLIVLLVIVVIAGVGVYFMPNHYIVTNSIEINKPVDVVYAQVADYNQWASWSPWKEKDPESKITVEGTMGEPGYKMSWEGKEVGQGSATLVNTSVNRSMNYNLDFVKPYKATAMDGWAFEDLGGGKTKVTWTTSGGLKFPMGRVMGPFMNKMVGEPEKHGLDNLKKICEAMPAPEPPVATIDTVSTVEPPKQ